MDLMDVKKSNLREKGLFEINLQMERLRKSIGPAALFLGRKLIEGAQQAAIRQLDIVLDCAAKYSTRPLIEIVDENIRAFLKNDMYAVWCNLNHPCCCTLQEIMKEWFAARIMAHRVLFQGQGATYAELVRSRFPEIETASAVLCKEFESGAKAVSLLESNPDLLKPPMGIGTHKVIS